MAAKNSLKPRDTEGAVLTLFYRSFSFNLLVLFSQTHIALSTRELQAEEKSHIFFLYSREVFYEHSLLLANCAQAP